MYMYIYMYIYVYIGVYIYICDYICIDVTYINISFCIILSSSPFLCQKTVAPVSPSPCRSADTQLSDFQRAVLHQAEPPRLSNVWGLNPMCRVYCVCVFSPNLMFIDVWWSNSISLMIKLDLMCFVVVLSMGSALADLQVMMSLDLHGGPPPSYEGNRRSCTVRDQLFGQSDLGRFQMFSHANWQTLDWARDTWAYAMCNSPKIWQVKVGKMMTTLFIFWDIQEGTTPFSPAQNIRNKNTLHPRCSSVSVDAWSTGIT